MYHVHVDFKNRNLYTYCVHVCTTMISTAGVLHANVKNKVLKVLKDKSEFYKK